LDYLHHDVGFSEMKEGQNIIKKMWGNINILLKGGKKELMTMFQLTQ
jgi:hypothetical protein